MKEFDESEAIEYIKNAVPQACEYDSDDLLLIIDTIFEYDEKIGEDATDEQLVPEAVAVYVSGQLKKDPDFAVAPELILPIVKAEQAYEDYLWSSVE